jgi:hypothetical protein
VKPFSVVYRTHDGAWRHYFFGRYGVLTGKQASVTAADQFAAARTAQPGEDPQAMKQAAQQAARMSTLRGIRGGDYGEWVKAQRKSEIKTLHRVNVVLKEFGVPA